MERDGHIRVLPIHVANKIAAGEVVERPASVVKELVENAIDAGSENIAITISQGGRKLVSVRDDGCGMTRDDAVLSLERQATSKILDVNDIESIDTLGFRGEAIPSIASVSRFSITTRRRESDEGTFLQVNAGTLAEVRSAGAPPGTLVEVRDLFCNVPARRKFLRAAATEEAHVKRIFTVHALAHPNIGFSLTIDGHELYRLAPSSNLKERVIELFGDDFVERVAPVVPDASREVRVSGYIEKPNLSQPTRRDQYVFVNGRPATSPSVAYAIREAYPRNQGDNKPAAILFLDLPPTQVDVNVHPTKREVRFRDNSSVKLAILAAIESALRGAYGAEWKSGKVEKWKSGEVEEWKSGEVEERQGEKVPPSDLSPALPIPPFDNTPSTLHPAPSSPHQAPSTLHQAPIEVEFAIEPDSSRSRPWRWFKYLAQSDSGYLLVETDAGIVTINPHAARERIVYERLLDTKGDRPTQTLLIPETVHLSPVESARIEQAADTIRAMGFAIEPFGRDTWKIDAVPQSSEAISAAQILPLIARDLSESAGRKGEKWREELIAKSVARSFAGASIKLTPEGAVKLVEELCACKMPYICPRNRPVMIFTSTRELSRRFGLD